jgi:hypothetical protein
MRNNFEKHVNGFKAGELVIDEGPVPEPVKGATGILFEDLVAHMKDREISKELKRLQNRAMQMAAIPPGVWEKDTFEDEAKPPAKKHVRIELPYKAPIASRATEKCEALATSDLWFAEDARRQEAVLREFKCRTREWPTCCGDECEVETRNIGMVVVRCRHG